MTERTISFGYTAETPEEEALILEAMAEGFTLANMAMIASRPEVYPCCTECGGYRYVPPVSCIDEEGGQDENCQHVHGAGPLHTTGHGTCFDLACMAAALMRTGDPNARVAIEFMIRDGKRQPGYHAFVIKGDGTPYDPAQAALALKVGGESCGCSGGDDHANRG